jgi:hypothetical protein
MGCHQTWNALILITLITKIFYIGAKGRFDIVGTSKSQTIANEGFISPLILDYFIKLFLMCSFVVFQVKCHFEFMVLAACAIYLRVISPVYMHCSRIVISALLSINLRFSSKLKWTLFFNQDNWACNRPISSYKAATSSTCTFLSLSRALENTSDIACNAVCFHALICVG